MYFCPEPCSCTVKGVGSGSCSLRVPRTGNRLLRCESYSHPREVKRDTARQRPRRPNRGQHDMGPAVQRCGQGGLRNLDVSHKTKPEAGDLAEL